MPEVAVPTGVGRPILEWLAAREEEMASFLRELALRESPSTEPGMQRPVQDLLAARLAEIGFEVRRIPGRKTGGHLYARPRGAAPGRPLQLLLGHSDTVWPAGTVERMPVVIEGTRLRGPGAFDMKGGLAQMVYALEALHALGLEPPLTPVVLVTSDEEIGSPESIRHIRRLARRAERAFILEPALGPEGKLKTARKGVASFEVEVIGKSAHGGLDPGAGASAILELSHVIRKVYGLGDAERGITVNVGLVEGGVRPNVVAPRARAVVDIRVPTEEVGREVEAAMRALAPETPGTRLEVTGKLERLPLEPTPRNRALWEAARAAGAALGLELEEASSGGGSDGNITSRHCATLDGLGPVGDGAHAEHEFVSVDRMPERAALLGLLLLAGSLEG